MNLMAFDMSTGGVTTHHSPLYEDGAESVVSQLSDYIKYSIS